MQRHASHLRSNTNCVRADCSQYDIVRALLAPRPKRKGRGWLSTGLFARGPALLGLLRLVLLLVRLLAHAFAISSALFLRIIRHELIPPNEICTTIPMTSTPSTKTCV